MKKITFILLFSFGFLVNAQQKSTGDILLTSNIVANLLLDNGTTTATLTLSGPNDRWFALEFGTFSSGMVSGTDLVYWNGATLVDARHNGVGNAPTTDTTNDWTLVSNTDNLPSSGLRTLVYIRALNTGDVNDFTFVYANASIDFAWARMDSASFVLAYHGGNNRGVSQHVALNVLGVEDFSLNASQIFPNPTNGLITIKSKTSLEMISIYSLTGILVKTIELNNVNNDNTEVNVEGLQAGIYLIELKNDTEKSWKKIIVN